MALYRIEFKNITRGTGRSVVSASAYRSAEKIKSEWDGLVYDYTKKGGVVYKEIMLPDNAPAEYKDRGTLWNAVEMAEPSVSCRLARECLLALPRELSTEQQIEVARQFAQKNFADKGMCVDIAIHSPIYCDDLNHPLDADGNRTDDPNKFQHNNPHAHILLTVRPIGKNGRWEAKTQKEYLCRRGDEEKGFTGEEFKQAQLDGWEKQFRFIGHDGKKVWLTPSEAKEKGFDNSDRVNKYPRSSPHGRENPTTAYWNDRKRVKEWRKSWEEILNEKFRELGMDIRVDSRSYKDQGIDKMPGNHTGWFASNMEKKASRLEKEGKTAEHTELGERNRIISDYNKSADGYHKAVKATEKKVRDTAGKMERLHIRIASNRYSGEVIGKGLRAVMDAAQNGENDIQTCLEMVDTWNVILEKANQEIARLTAMLESLGAGHWRERAELEEQIAERQERLDVQEEHVRDTLAAHGFVDETQLRECAKEQAESMRELRDRQGRVDELERSVKADRCEYQDLKQSVPESYQDRVSNERKKIREEAELSEVGDLKEKLGNEFHASEYHRTVMQTEKDLNKTTTKKEQRRGQNR